MMFCSLLILLLSLSFTNVHAAGRSISVGTFPLEPLNFFDQDHKAQGLYPDIVRKIARDEGWEPHFTECAFGECLEMLQNGEIDLMTTIAYSKKRAEIFDYNQEPAVNIWGQIFLRPAEKVSNILDLSGKKVAIMRRGINGVNFKKTAEKFGVACIYVEFDNHQEIFEAVQEKVVDAGVAPQHYGLLHAHEYNLVGSSIIFAPFSVYFAVKHGHNTELLKVIDRHLRRWKSDRSSYYYQRLSFWMGGKDYGKQTIPPWLLNTLYFVVLTALALFVHTRVLNSKVRKRTQDLQESENKFRQLVESANSIIMRWDSEGRILFMNDFGLRLFGFSTDEIVGKNVVGTIVSQTDSSGQDLQKMIVEIRTNPEQYAVNENENICRDNRIVYIQWTNRAIVNNQNQIKEILSVGTDITMRKQLEDELLMAQKMEAIGNLAGGIAHDFNNILTAIFGFSELSKLESHNPEAVRRYADEVLSGAKRARSLVQQILTFGRKQNSPKSPVQVGLLVEEAIGLLRASIPVSIEIKQRIRSTACVLASSTQIHQIIMNLCTNAYHAMREDGGVLSITLDETFRAKKAYIHLKIDDTGGGIPVEIKDKLFEPYFTTKGEGEGTGLGLAVVHGIVENHDGVIEVESNPGQGAKFHVYLPIYSKACEIMDKNNVALENGGSERIMLVDDEEAILSVQENLLSRQGYQVRSYAAGEEALEDFRKNPEDFDLVISDMTMPRMNGRELAAAILKLSPKTPVIICTGHSDLLDYQSAMAMGIKEYLEKPLQNQELFAAIRRALLPLSE